MSTHRRTKRNLSDLSPSSSDSEDFLESQEKFTKFNFRTGIIVYWVLMHVSITSVYLFQPSPLSKHTEQGDFVYVGLFWGLIAITFLLYFRSALMDPGFLENRPEKDVELGNESHMLQQTNQQKRDSHDSHDEKTTTWCDLCQLEQPIRTRHCYICRRCVEKYDHHCAWIGQCVGQRNHFWFWWYLLFETILLVWAVEIGFRGVYERTMQTEPWSFGSILLVIALVLSFLLAMLPGLLLCFHTYLICTNQTSWENMRRHRIHYMKHLPTSVLAFDHGISENIRLFCLALPRDHTWVVTTVIEPSSNPCYAESMICC